MDRPAGFSETVTVTFSATDDGAVLVPVGIATPHQAIESVAVAGAATEAAVCAEGLETAALVIRPEADKVAVRYRVATRSGSYPEAAFRHRPNRYTVAADDLAAAARDSAARATDPIAAIVAETEARFVYDHPEARFNDGADAVPLLACGTTPGSCIDINTYLVASLRAAGIETAYLTGYFFPEERGGVTHEMHCWVATRHGGTVREWDIAHHMKAGLGPTRPGLNPRPGRRVATSHSMGHVYPMPAGRVETKLLAEPMRIVSGTTRRVVDLWIELGVELPG